MKYDVKDIAIIALTAALTVVIGYLFYVVGSFFPIPGYKFIIFAPFLGFMIFIPTRKIQKVGVISAVSIVFAALMTPVSVFMGIAIFMTGITTDLLTLLLLHNYNQMWKITASVGLYPMFSVLWSFLVSYYFTGNAMYQLVGGWISILLLCLVIYILGVVGAYLSNKVIFSRISKSIIS
ncbi:hypothetical protein Amet_0473 [Alkaliphilus metalliredigens QYMF]|uniref:Energy-coupling factor transport system substrate-specific component n=1 Tax=Alkaliphilus metalliredigens (strain QYMF) TaxID=293826 RepID=A6TKI2_ALKMQ|nr:hypothetical protein [Alkaliphilus metalliredigens]ABR46700.1 hypothetical protein Amet_0473 [Alkaliphilus metalliredigens QYMF]